MTYRGKIKGGVVVFEVGVKLPEGAEVQVTLPEAADQRVPTLLDRLGPVVGKAKGLPADASENVDHYLYGQHPQIMTSVFADTSFYVAVLNPKDNAHTKARACGREFQGTLVSTDFVPIEVGNWLSRSGDRAVFLELIDRLRADSRTTIIPASRTLVERGLQLYAERPDKDWSLTDCISFVVMRDEHISDALTADRHFAQAGFRALLR